MRTDSGLEYEIEEEGTGAQPKPGDRVEGTGAQPKPGDRVAVHYTGRFPEGRAFDSSLDRGEPLTFTLGRGEVILGWDEGIALLHEGGKAHLTIPPQLAYGERGAGGVIPPNATLVFDVELVKVNP